MFEIINSMMLWWHWIIIGIVLIILEIFITTFMTLWLGCSALIVGLLDYFFNLSFEIELTIWIILSIIFTYLWLKIFRYKTEGSGKSNTQDYSILGVVEEDIEIGKKGRVHFDRPVLGDSDWLAISDNRIAKGSRVKIVDIVGQLIKVEEI